MDTEVITNLTVNASTGLFGVNLYTEKIIVMISMAVVTFLFGMIPIKLFSTLRNNTDAVSRQRWKTIISFASCFAGGVFIAACLLDLFPEVQEQITSVLEQIKDVYHVDLDYPVSEFIIVLGFFLILIIEQTVLHFQESWIAEEEERQPLLGGSSNNRRYDSQETYQHQHSHGSYQHQHSQDSHHAGHQHDDLHVHVTPETTSLTGVSNEVHHANDGHHDHDHISHGVFEHSALRSILLLVALSFHSVFEGLSIGLQKTNDQLISIFIAVIVHKAVMAFSLGLNIAQSNLSVRSFIVSNIIFSIASPIGLGIGIAVTDLPNTLPREIASGVLQGICGGTFLYITFFEVLPHEMNVPSNRLWKVFFIILGYACICGLLFIAH